MIQPRTFYVLGAGASANLVPFTYDLRKRIKQDYWQLGMFPASRALPTKLFKRVIGGYQGTGSWDSQEVAIFNIPPGALELLVQKQLSYDLYQPIPPQYGFLQLVGAPSVFFNFNLDGLASSYLRPRHVVFEPHGALDREWTDAPDYLSFLEMTQDITLPHLRPKLLPGSEPRTITRTTPYLSARAWLRHAPTAILLGYSFGKNANGSFDDAESFEYIAEHLRGTDCSVFVVSREPFELAALIEERLRAKRTLPVALRWDTFTREAMSIISPGQSVSEWVCEDQVRILEHAYLDGLELAG